MAPLLSAFQENSLTILWVLYGATTVCFPGKFFKYFVGTVKNVSYCDCSSNVTATGPFVYYEYHTWYSYVLIFETASYLGHLKKIYIYVCVCEKKKRAAFRRSKDPLMKKCRTHRTSFCFALCRLIFCFSHAPQEDPYNIQYISNMDRYLTSLVAYALIFFVADQIFRCLVRRFQNF